MLCCLAIPVQLVMSLCILAALLPLAILRTLELVLCQCALLPDSYHSSRPFGWCGDCGEGCSLLVLCIACCPCILINLIMGERCGVAESFDADRMRRKREEKEEEETVGWRAEQGNWATSAPTLLLARAGGISLTFPAQPPPPAVKQWEDAEVGEAKEEENAMVVVTGDGDGGAGTVSRSCPISSLSIYLSLSLFLPHTP